MTRSLNHHESTTYNKLAPTESTETSLSSLDHLNTSALSSQEVTYMERPPSQGDQDDLYTRYGIEAITDKPEDERTVEDEVNFLTYMTEMYSKNEVNKKTLTLRVLYSRGEYDELYNKLETFTEENLTEDPAYQAYLADIGAIRNRRKTGGPDDIKQLSEKIDELEARHRELLLIESEVPAKAALGKIEQAKEAIQQQLANKLGTEYTTEQALVALGIKNEDQNIFHYPKALMPKEVNQEWLRYLKSVCKNLTLDIEMRQNSELRDDFVQSDSARTAAHNAVTSSVHHVLGLDADFLAIREMLANARDTDFSEHGYTSRATVSDLVRIQEELEQQYSPQ